MKPLLICIATLLLLTTCLSFGQGSRQVLLSVEPGEEWFSGVVAQGWTMPLTVRSDVTVDLYGENEQNQVQPLLLSNKGRYVWSEDPFQFSLKGGKLTVVGRGELLTGKQGNTLKEAQQYATKTFFPPSGLLPDTLLVARPQYNTWIELNYNHKQVDVLKYAHAIVDNGLPTGVLMIDDTWQEDYGVWKFHPGRFPNPKAMVDELHQLGFKVMVWVAPFMSADQAVFRALRKQKACLLEQIPGQPTDWATSKADPIIVSWWNGFSAQLDLSNPTAVTWFESTLDSIVREYGVDGFKFDGADMRYYPSNTIAYQKGITPNQHCQYYAQVGLKYPLNEYRACWKMGGKPLVQRLNDKSHSWGDLRKLIPNMLLAGLMGYTFCCPDMIGGGEITSFQGLNGNLDPALIVRSAQCHALMPMMQFSVAPWRVLDQRHLDAVKKAVAIRTQFTPLLMQITKASAKTGEPIVRPMDYVFPNQGFAEERSQFMLGDSLLVAPVLEKGATQRRVKLPAGNWRADDGQRYKGGTTVLVDVPLERLPYFSLTK